VNFDEVKPYDQRWTPREQLVFVHLLRTRQRYLDEGRKQAAHGTAKSVYVMANVLLAFEAQHGLPDSTPDPFRTLL
jgi:hypothetical protein